MAAFTVGFESIDRHLSTREDPQLVLMGSRPGVGKTTLAIHTVLHLISQGQRVFFFSVEMSKQELLVRFLSAKSECLISEIQAGTLSESSQALVEAARAELTENLIIDDMPSMNFAHIRSAVGIANANGPKVDVIVVDYLQLLTVPRLDPNVRPEWQQIAALGSNFRSLIQEFGCSALVLSQLNRGAPADAPPLLRPSGAFEQDVDLSLILREAETLNQHPTLRVLTIDKNRRGASGISSNLNVSFYVQAIWETSFTLAEAKPLTTYRYHEVSEMLKSSLTSRGIDQWWYSKNSFLGDQEPIEALYDHGDFKSLKRAAKAFVNDFKH